MTALSDDQIRNLIRRGERLEVEFKGEKGGPISDKEIYETAVCLANSLGGTLLIGVENDGRITGASPRHGDLTHPAKLQSAIFNNTAPPLNARVSVHKLRRGDVIAVAVDQSSEICSTKEGKCLKRNVGLHGPECQPFYAYQHQSRRSDLGLSDYSSQHVEAASWKDLDPLELERIRQAVSRGRGDTIIRDLDDLELAKALRLVETRGRTVRPTVTGLLLAGKTESIRKWLPTHELAFQVLDSRGNVLTNDWFSSPLLKTLQAVEDRFAARNQEQETQVGLVRLAIPEYSREALREALNNAVMHRDYARRGPVFIQFHPDHLEITNPGGFPEGITLQNLLVHEPKPRNSLLADALKRAGLVETTGRGIDKIYLGQLLYGRPVPDYSLSDRENVRVTLRGGEANLGFAAFVFEQERAGSPLGLNELLALNQLQHERRVTVDALGKLTQRGDAHARSILERLVEGGLVEAKGERKARVYHLSAATYKRLGDPAGYVRVHGFDVIRQEAMVLQYVEAHRQIARRHVADLCSIGTDQARSLLRRMIRKGSLRLVGSRRAAFYQLPKHRVK